MTLPHLIDSVIAFGKENMPRHKFSKDEQSRGGHSTSANQTGEEYMLGFCPSTDEYSEYMDTPLWDDLLTLLANEKIDRFEILFCGKARSDGRIGGTGFGLTDRGSAQRVALKYWTPGEGRLKDITQDPENTALFAKELLGLNVQPQHITGIVVVRYGG